MNGISSSNRKRPRSPDLDCEECMPISKRIHNLNIRSRGCSIDEDCDNPGNNNVRINDNNCCGTDSCQPQPGTSSSTDSAQWLSTASGPHVNGRSQSSHTHVPHIGHTSGFNQQVHGNQLPNPCADSISNSYEPDLDATENPHYYHQNRLLYDAHIQRVQRNKPD